MKHAWIRNLSVYAIKSFQELSVEQLEEALKEALFRGIGPLEAIHKGFIPAYGFDKLVRCVDGVYWLQLKTESKRVNGREVKEMLEERLAEIEAQEARKVGKKERKRLKEEITDILMAKAEPTSSITTIAILPKIKRIFIDTASMKVAESALGMLAHYVPGLSVSLLKFRASVGGRMTDVLMNEGPSDITADATLVLKGQGDSSETVKFDGGSLDQPEVRAHLMRGLVPVSLGMTWDGRISFVLTDPYTLRKLSYIGQILEDVAGLDDVEAQQQLSGILAMQALELEELTAFMEEWLDVEPPETLGQAE